MTVSKHKNDNRNIFVYWENADGSSVVPPYIKLCLDTIKKRSEGIPLHFITATTATNFIEDLRADWHLLSTIAHKVDYLRPRVLHRFGGVFLDIDAICLDSVNRFFEPLEKHSACGFGESPEKPYIGCLSAIAGSALMKEWAERQDENFRLNEGWVHFGAAQLWKCDFDETYWQCPLELVEPFTWDNADQYDSNLNARKLIEARSVAPILFALFNKVLPKEIKNMSEIELLTHESFIGQCFRIALEKDSNQSTHAA